MFSRAFTLALVPFITTLSGVAIAADFHGYLRTGAGTTLSGDRKGEQECLTLAGTEHKFRLGNECDNYLELAVDHQLNEDESERQNFSVHARVGYLLEGYTDRERDTNGASSSAEGIILREAYGTASGVLGDSTLWAGTRLYKRHDIYISDFYILDDSGIGAGIDNMLLGPLNMSYALMQHSNSNQMVHDVRVSDIELFGSLEVIFQFVDQLDEEDYAKNPLNAAEDNASNGYALTVSHVLGGVVGGYNKATFQYAIDRASPLSNNPSDYALDDTLRMRFTDQLVWHYGDTLSGMAMFIFDQWTRDDLAGIGGIDDTVTWMSMGVRPVYHYNENISLAFEYGYDSIENAFWSGSDGTLTKMTIAPQITPTSGFWSRPTFRLYFTYFDWDVDATWMIESLDSSRELKDPSATVQFAGEENGMAAGIQFESWW